MRTVDTISHSDSVLSCPEHFGIFSSIQASREKRWSLYYVDEETETRMSMMNPTSPESRQLTLSSTYVSLPLCCLIFG